MQVLYVRKDRKPRSRQQFQRRRTLSMMKGAQRPSPPRPAQAQPPAPPLERFCPLATLIAGLVLTVVLPIRSLICLAMVKKACSTFCAFLAEVSKKGMPKLSANSCLLSVYCSRLLEAEFIPLQLCTQPPSCLPYRSCCLPKAC